MHQYFKTVVHSSPQHNVRCLDLQFKVFIRCLPLLYLEKRRSTLQTVFLVSLCTVRTTYNMSSLWMGTHVFQYFFPLNCLFHSENELCILCKMLYAANLHRPHKYLALGKKKQTLNILMRPFQSSMYWSEFKWIKHLLCFCVLHHCSSFHVYLKFCLCI